MKKIYLTLIIGMFLLMSVSALDNLGTYKQGSCLNISQTCSSCSYVNISSISNQNNSNLITNVEMTSIGGGEWRYEFCDTNYIGRYDVKGQGDINSIDTSFATYFEISGTGQESIPEGSSNIITIALVLMIIFAALFIVLAFRVNQPTFILIFFSIAVVSLFMATLFSMTLIDNLMGGYENIVSGYTAFVMFFKILISMGVLTLVLFAGYKALQLWKFKRGLSDND